MVSTWGVLSGNGQVFAGTVAYSNYTSEFVTYHLGTGKTTVLKTSPNLSPFQIFTSFRISKNGNLISTIAQPLLPNLPGYFVANEGSADFVQIYVPEMLASQAVGMNPDGNVDWVTYRKPSSPSVYLVRVDPKTKTYQETVLPVGASLTRRISKDRSQFVKLLPRICDRRSCCWKLHASVENSWS
jgi:hypothetical protein